MDVSTLVAAGIALAGALIALIWLPTHAKPATSSVDLDAELAALREEEGVELRA